MNKDDHTNAEGTHIQPVINKLTNTANTVKMVHFNQKMVVRKLKSHYKLAASHNKKIVVFSVIESVLMFFIFILQSCYIKSLIKRM